MDEVSLKKHLDYYRAQDRVVGALDAEGKVPATAATVFMVNGVLNKWRQAFSYFFVKNCMPSKSLVQAVRQALDILTQIGLEVVAVVSDQGSNFNGLRSGSVRAAAVFHPW